MKSPLHFLHIGKTGGTALRHALRNVSSVDKFRLVMHNHPTKLVDIPPGEACVFFLRDPVSRFSSGFASRFRKGQPRYNVPWTAKEKTAFERFQTPNNLAIALSSNDDPTRYAAESAMRGINHVRFGFADWFQDPSYLLSRKMDLFFIGFQETLEEDFTALRTKLGLGPEITLPAIDSISAHQMPSNIDASLEQLAVYNLRGWFDKDYEFFELCQQLKDQVNSQYVR